MNRNNRDYFMLAANCDKPKRRATTLELAALVLAAVSVIALSGLLI
ncbi:hypothetical protein [Seongchinamella unica]|nr:hypothetical protein [Seongchinamella unica]